jgi:hypothetical protein
MAAFETRGSSAQSGKALLHGFGAHPWCPVPHNHFPRLVSTMFDFNHDFSAPIIVKGGIGIIRVRD